MYLKSVSYYTTNCDYQVIDVVDKAHISKVNNYIRTNRRNNSAFNMRYCVFEHNRNLYYCYDIIDNYLLCYDASIAEHKKNYKRISVNNVIYYLDINHPKRMKKSIDYKLIGKKTGR